MNLKLNYSVFKSKAKLKKAQQDSHFNWYNDDYEIDVLEVGGFRGWTIEVVEKIKGSPYIMTRKDMLALVTELSTNPDQYGSIDKISTSIILLGHLMKLARFDENEFLWFHLSDR